MGSQDKVDKNDVSGISHDNAFPTMNNNLSQKQQRSSPVRVRRRGSSGLRSPLMYTKKTGRSITNINRINVVNNYGVDGRKHKADVGWRTLRMALAIPVIFWLGMTVSVMRSAPSASSGLRLLRSTHMSPATAVEPSLFGPKHTPDFQLSTPSAPSCSKPLEAESVAYTLVSQLSDDRLWMVPFHCERIPSMPMSIVVFSDRTADSIKSELVGRGCSEVNLTVQTVSKTKYDPTGTEYPVNLLRNMAISAVKTSHIVYVDVDFWPSSNLHSILSSPTVKGRFASDPKLLTVIPVFQMFRRCKEYKDCFNLNIPVMPKTIRALFNLIKKRQASVFDPTNVGGHGSTKYITWRDQDTGTFEDLPCIKSNRYEPYLAFRYCSDLPPFQEAFTGYGKNKMTWVMQLRRAGYLFSQLGGVFLVHYPHLNSQSRIQWDKKPKKSTKSNETVDLGSFKRAQVDALFVNFKEWLDGTVEDESRVPMCEDALNDDMRLWTRSGMNVWEVGNKEEESEDEGDDDGEYFEEYASFLDAEESLSTCQEDHSSNLVPCFKAASDFIKNSTIWSSVGAKSDYMGPDTQMEYLVAAEECARRYLDFIQDGGSDIAEDNNVMKYSFRKLLAELYTSMGAVERKRNATAKAKSYVKQALEMDPEYETAVTMLSELSEKSVEERTLESESTDEVSEVGGNSITNRNQANIPEERIKESDQ